METIAAIATGTSPTAIGIIRLSGEGTDEIVSRVFRPKSGRPLSACEPRRMIYGDVLDRNGAVIDHGLAVRFPAPGSYTGEDCAELHCHGSPVVLREALNALFAAGARQAKAGEFTRRAFLNGKMDLTQAEAVVDLIEAETAAAARNAAAQLDGALRRGIETTYDRLLSLASRFYAVVDYPDEDIEDLSLPEITSVLREAEETLNRLLSTFERGTRLKNGAVAAIVGRPNVGKSSLLNALVGYDRAIVTPAAGTTRDTVEEKAVLGGVLLRLIDTAGIRETGDPIEVLGVARAKDAAGRAALALLVLDGSQPLTQEDADAMAAAEAAPAVIAVVNKADLPPAFDLSAVTARFPQSVRVSARMGEGLSDLDREVSALFPVGSAPEGEVLTDARQQEAVFRAGEAVSRALKALDARLTPDAILTDVEEALSALGELTGKTAREDMVSRIFERFCVGK